MEKFSIARCWSTQIRSFQSYLYLYFSLEVYRARIAMKVDAIILLVNEFLILRLKVIDFISGFLI